MRDLALIMLGCAAWFAIGWIFSAATDGRLGSDRLVIDCPDPLEVISPVTGEPFNP